MTRQKNRLADGATDAAYVTQSCETAGHGLTRGSSLIFAYSFDVYTQTCFISFRFIYLHNYSSHTFTVVPEYFNMTMQVYEKVENLTPAIPKTPEPMKIIRK